MRPLLFRLPVPGDTVGQYRVVAPLGRGGQSHVYKVECAGRFFVLKVFPSRPGRSPWGELELDILRHLQHPNVVRVLGYGRWPDPEQGFFYIVMEFVEGLTLEAHALEHNPSARQAATLLLKAARALGVVHRQGVHHRDVKPENLLVRAVDGEPVWVDFGVGHLKGRTTAPGMSGLPPGTPEFASPEAYRFLQEHFEEQVRYRPGVADEVWAFGVTTYWLLTDVLPFGERGTNPTMVKDILTRTPEMPHERNPSVPVELSGVCMRMLEKEPRARYADMEAVAVALEESLAGAGEEAFWDAPMLDPDAPERRTTEEIPGMVVDRDAKERFMQMWKAGQSRRGRVRKARRGLLSLIEGPPAVVAPVEEAEQADDFEAMAESLEAWLLAPRPLQPGVEPAAGAAAVAARPAAPVHEAEAAPPEPAAPVHGVEAAPPEPAAPVHGVEAAPPEPAAPVPGVVRRVLSRLRSGVGVPLVRAVAVALAGVLLGALLLARPWAVQDRPASVVAPTSAPTAPEAPLLPGWLEGQPTLHASLGGEVAAPWESSEAGRGAVPFTGPTPAPVFATMLRKEDARLKPEEKLTPRPQRKAPGCVPTVQETCVVGICTILLTGCPGTPQVVRPPPRPSDCPPGAVKTMTEELGLRIGEEGFVSFPKEGGARPVTVRESTQVELLMNFGKLYGGTELSGRLYLGAERIYGRFTQARTPAGKTYPVCIELAPRDSYERGVQREDTGGPADSAVVISNQRGKVVDHFE
ncbi:serine/threonine-protein kinase [Vitiosangium sp. GDMCC 1.1324]|uniref:serine/threonine protein kinase n=1 Tax=Vitiosangium sp. (strain GDMCC 1.1324) TaxID=2138576 RepID=UPI0011B6D87E|nr:serine/threonine-protein kinase [Vitiosangium sp. GDMCC 1.1324]